MQRRCKKPRRSAVAFDTDTCPISASKKRKGGKKKVICVYYNQMIVCKAVHIRTANFLYSHHFNNDIKNGKYNIKGETLSDCKNNCIENCFHLKFLLIVLFDMFIRIFWGVFYRLLYCYISYTANLHSSLRR